MSAVATGDGLHERIVARLLAARERYGRDAMRRVEHAFLHYARLRPPLRPRDPLQRPTWLLPGVEDAGPWPASERLPALARLEQAAELIRDEALAALGQQQPFDDGTPHSGRWSAIHLRYGSRPVDGAAQRMPRTSALIAELPQLGEMAMISVLDEGCHIKPHCGLHNYRWTAHLGLQIPEHCWFRVGSETRRWQPGHCLLFDDSYDHEARNDGPGARVILLIDFWHPDLRADEIAVLDSIAGDLAELRRMP